MSETDISFFAMVALIAINQFLIRTKYWQKQMWIFWVTQLLNSALGSWALFIGLPGLNESLSVINWIIGLLFFYHIARNQVLLQRFLRESRKKKPHENAHDLPE
ncbi:MAG: hypothetical protein VX278_21625 [Myxococcota bacterium]|nr:hypothetical protein [Myxococcota bacterium]